MFNWYYYLPADCWDGPFEIILWVVVVADIEISVFKAGGGLAAIELTDFLLVWFEKTYLLLLCVLIMSMIEAAAAGGLLFPAVIIEDES
jgi:hypothetical protein